MPEHKAMINTLFSYYKSTNSLRICVCVFLLITSNLLLAQDVPYKTLIGHSDAVSTVNFSPDGKLLASASGDSTIRLWSLADNKLIRTFKLKTNWGNCINEICFSPDGTRLAIASNCSNEILILNVNTFKEYRIINHIGDNGVWLIRFSPDGQTLTSSNYLDDIRIWSVSDGKLLKTIMNDHHIRCIEYSPNGKTIAAGDDEGNIVIWDIATGKLLKKLTEIDVRAFSSLNFSSDGNTITSIEYNIDQIVKVWNLSDGKIINSINSKDYSCYIITLNPNGKTIAGIGFQDSFIKLIGLSDGKLQRTLNIDHNIKLTPRFSKNGNLIASIDYKVIKLYNLQNSIIPKPLAPANLQVSSIRFNDSLGNNNQVLDGNEKASLKFTINNTGKGDAYQLKAIINMSKPVSGLDFPKTFDIGDLPSGMSTTVTIPVKGTMQLEAAKAEWKIEVKEGNGFDADPFTISFTTQPFKSPLLSVADYKFTSDEAGKIRLGQSVSLQIMLQNKGQGEATDIKVEVQAPENVFPANESIFTIDKLMPNESRILHYEFFANKKYTGTEIPIKVNITEQYKRYGENRTLSVSLDQNLAKTQLVEIAGVSDKPISINSIYLTSDVNRDIPVGTIKQPNTFALIIGNEDYSSYQKGITTEMNVAYAKNDALTFREYCSKTLGIPDENITCVLDATAGKMWQEIDRLSKLIQATNGKASVIFYYAGHGLPDEQSKEPYLIPVDVTGSNITAAIKLSTVYEKLNEYPSKQVTVFLDACFSGGARDGALLASRAIRITPKSDYLKGNIVVFTASSGDESALPWKAQQHGMFTYFLLKKLQETKGEFTYAELNTYLRENVGLESVRTNSKKQNPQVLISPEIEKNWQEWRLK